MARQKSSVISVRVSESVKNKLEVESEMNGTTLNTLISQVLTKHVEWDRYASDVGFIFLTKPFLRGILDEVNEKKIKLLAVSVCRGAIRDAILFIKGELNIENVIKAFDLWFGASHMAFRHITNNGIDKYIIQHDLGKKWSMYIETVVNSILSEIGYRTHGQKIDEYSVVFEIVKAN